MKILITGSHFTPAQAVIEKLQETDKNIDIVYVGRKTTMEGDLTPSAESQILPKMGIKFIPITTGRLRRFISIGTFISLLKLPIGFIQAFWFILTEQPSVVVSFGGYVGVPVVFWAWAFGIPVLIHEQTQVSGLSNGISSHFANKIAVTFDIHYPFKKEKIILTGNPMRKAIVSSQNHPSSDIKKFLENSKRKKLPLVLVTGGNQGSHLLNQAVADSLEELTEKYIVVHQTGDSKFKDFETISELTKVIKSPENYYVTRFLDGEDMAAILKSADVVISRAGANTLLELAYLGVPTLVIPIPYLYKNEQVKNAKYFKEAGLGEVIYQNDFTKEEMMKNLAEMTKNNKFKLNAAKAKEVVIPDAASKLAQQSLIMAQKNV